MTMAAWCVALALSLFYGPQIQAAPPTRDAILKASRTIIANARYATLVTASTDSGSPDARIIDPFTPDPDMSIWFATNPKSRKVAELAKDPHVTLLYFDATAKGYVTLKGKATLVRDAGAKAARWKDDWMGMYADKNHGDDYLLVKVVPETLEVVSVALNMINDPATWKPVTLMLR